MIINQYTAEIDHEELCRRDARDLVIFLETLLIHRSGVFKTVAGRLTWWDDPRTMSKRYEVTFDSRKWTGSCRRS